MDLVGFLITLLILGIVLYLLIWLVDSAPIPEPFKAVLHWLVIAIAVIWLISLLLGLAGYDAGTRFPVFRFNSRVGAAQGSGRNRLAGVVTTLAAILFVPRGRPR
jgi:hypothetical protein